MKTSLNPWLQSLYKAASLRTAQVISRAALDKSALVFSPHQDDETLGCGGTIYLKICAGAQVRVVFMADGRTSHSYFIPEEELVELRREEARAACRRLGLLDNEVFFLDFPDGRLNQFHNQAVEKTAELLFSYQPAEVFIPYYLEPTPDHQSANRIVKAALKKVGLQVSVFEYPVWFWYQWPWVQLVQPRRRATYEIARNTLKTGLGFRLIKDFRHAVIIEDVLDEKRAALEEHRSQMTELLPDRGWPTLWGIAGGEFLACFFQERELFYCYTPNAKKKA
jgi:LmbE family N-acetylglucosaminyl deacetylase